MYTENDFDLLRAACYVGLCTIECSDQRDISLEDSGNRTKLL